MVMVLAACGQSPPPRGTLPDAATVIPEPQACAVLVGESLGVAVEDVIANTGADGVLQSGDLLVSVDGEAVTSATVLREIVERAPLDWLIDGGQAVSDLAQNLGGSGEPGQSLGERLEEIARSLGDRLLDELRDRLGNLFGG